MKHKKIEKESTEKVAEKSAEIELVDHSATDNIMF